MTLCSVYVAKLFAIGGPTKLAHFLLVLVALMMPSRGTYSCSRACITGLTPKSSAWRFRQINEKRVRLESATQLHQTEYESVRVVSVGQESPRTSPGLPKDGLAGQQHLTYPKSVLNYPAWGVAG